MELQSANVNELFTALSKAQAKMGLAKKQSSNPFFKSKYASLDAVWEACKDYLAEQGLAISQTTVMQGEQLLLVTTLGHASGQWSKGLYPINPIKLDPQGFGSAMTYARRYSLAAIVGIAFGDDDDGESAQGRGSKLSESQVSYVDKALNGDAAKRQAMLAWVKEKFGGESISDIPADKFDMVIRRLSKGAN